MNYDEIQKVADDFKEDADQNRMIAKILEGIINVLKVVAKIVPFIDLEHAISAHKKGDYAGMSRFGEGTA
jgi:hypothetical protein